MTTTGDEDAAPADGGATAVVLDALGDEVLGLYGSARALVAIDAASARAAISFGAAWRDRLRRRGRAAGLLEAGEVDDAQEFRASVVRPYRAGRTVGGEAVWGTIPAGSGSPEDGGLRPAVLLVAGTRLLRRDLRDLWHFAVRLDTPADEGAAGPERSYVGAEAPRRTADAVVDTTDPGFPRRLYLDAC